MVAARAGKRSPLGCLFMILLLAAGGYYGWEVGEAYLRYYRMLDEMKVQARFATNLEDGVIRRRLRAKADELELPPDAKKITIRRRSRPREIIIQTEWLDTLDLPFVQHVKTFRAEAREPL